MFTEYFQERLCGEFTNILFMSADVIVLISNFSLRVCVSTGFIFNPILINLCSRFFYCVSFSERQ